MGRSTTTDPPCPYQGRKSSSTRPRNSYAHGTSMESKDGTSAWPHSTTGATAFTYRRHGENAHPKQYSFYPQRRHARYVLRQHGHRCSQAPSRRPCQPCTGRTLCLFWRPDHGCHPTIMRNLCCNWRTNTNPYPTPKAHPRNYTATPAAEQH